MNDSQIEPKPKKNNSKIAIMIAVLAVLVMVIYLVNNYFVKLSDRKTAESIVNLSTNEQVEVANDTDSIKVSNGDSTINAGDKVAWPSDMPAGLIRPNFGTVNMSSVIAADKAWNVVLSGVTADQFTTYKTSLLKNGWVSDVETTFGFSIVSLKKDNWDLTLTYDPSSTGLSINILPVAN